MATVFTLRPSADEHGKQLFQAVLKANDELHDHSLAIRKALENLERGTWAWQDIKALRALEAEVYRIRNELFAAAGEWAGAKSDAPREAKVPAKGVA